MSVAQTEFSITSAARLTLRTMRVGDAEAVHRYRNQVGVSQFQGWTPASLREVADYAKQMQTRPIAAPGHWHQMVIELNQASDTLQLSSVSPPIVGDLAFNIDCETGKQAELGIVLGREFQNKGFANEAVTTLLGYLFDSLKLHRVHVSIDPDNAASLRLFSKAGFRREGHLKQAFLFEGRWYDDVIMAILRSEWSQFKR